MGEEKEPTNPSVVQASAVCVLGILVCLMLDGILFSTLFITWEELEVPLPPVTESLIGPMWIIFAIILHAIPVFITIVWKKNGLFIYCILGILFCAYTIIAVTLPFIKLTETIGA